LSPSGLTFCCLFHLNAVDRCCSFHLLRGRILRLWPCGVHCSQCCIQGIPWVRRNSPSVSHHRIKPPSTMLSRQNIVLFFLGLHHCSVICRRPSASWELRSQTPTGALLVDHILGDFHATDLLSNPIPKYRNRSWECLFDNGTMLSSLVCPSQFHSRFAILYHGNKLC